MQTLLNAAAVYMILDFFAFWLWIITGQLPIDGYYLGCVTAWVLRFVIGLLI